MTTIYNTEVCWLVRAREETSAPAQAVSTEGCMAKGTTERSSNAMKKLLSAKTSAPMALFVSMRESE